MVTVNLKNYFYQDYTCNITFHFNELRLDKSPFNPKENSGKDYQSKYHFVHFTISYHHPSDTLETPDLNEG